VLVTAASQPAEYRYLAFPSLLRTGPDEVWMSYKAGRSHATDAGAALEVVRHTLSTGATKLIQRLPAPPPKLYQMGEFARLPDGSTGIYVDVQSTGWDGRHYRSGAEIFRWNESRQVFDEPRPLGTISPAGVGAWMRFGPTTVAGRGRLCATPRRSLAGFTATRVVSCGTRTDSLSRPGATIGSHGCIEPTVNFACATRSN
jgi:hypothetical protein